MELDLVDKLKRQRIRKELSTVESSSSYIIVYHSGCSLISCLELMRDPTRGSLRTAHTINCLLNFCRKTQENGPFCGTADMESEIGYFLVYPLKNLDVAQKSGSSTLHMGCFAE